MKCFAAREVSNRLQLLTMDVFQTSKTNRSSVFLCFWSHIALLVHYRRQWPFILSSLLPNEGSRYMSSTNWICMFSSLAYERSEEKQSRSDLIQIYFLGR